LVVLRAAVVGAAPAFACRLAAFVLNEGMYLKAGASSVGAAFAFTD
jgi:hypothetical protein